MRHIASKVCMFNIINMALKIREIKNIAIPHRKDKEFPTTFHFSIVLPCIPNYCKAVV